MNLVCGSCWSQGKPPVFKIAMTWTYTLETGDDGQILISGRSADIPFDPDSEEVEQHMACGWCDNKLLMPTSWIVRTNERGERVSGVTIDHIKNKPVCLSCNATDNFCVAGMIDFVVSKNGPGLTVQHLIEDGVDLTDAGAIELVERMLEGRPVEGSYLICRSCGLKNVDLVSTESAPVLNGVEFHRVMGDGG